jgi:hypothetical protein
MQESMVEFDAMPRVLARRNGSIFRFRIRDSRYFVYLNYLAAFAAKNPTKLFPENGK